MRNVISLNESSIRRIVREETIKKDRQNFYRHLKKIGVPYKVRIELSRLYRKRDGLIWLDDVCKILDDNGISHDLINVSYDDLERYRCEYYNGYWINDDTKLVCDNGRFILSNGIDFHD